MNHAHLTRRPARSFSYRPIEPVRSKAPDGTDPPEPWRVAIHAQLQEHYYPPSTHKEADQMIGREMVRIIDQRRGAGEFEPDDLYRAIAFAIVTKYELHPSAAGSIANAAEALVGDYARFVCQPSDAMRPRVGHLLAGPWKGSRGGIAGPTTL